MKKIYNLAMSFFIISSFFFAFDFHTRAEELSASYAPLVLPDGDEYVDGGYAQYNSETDDNSDTSPLPKVLSSSKDLSQALAWGNSQKGKSIDVDGFPVEQKFQCVDLTMAYSEYLFGTHTNGNAFEYASRNYTGFTRLSKSTDQS